MKHRNLIAIAAVLPLLGGAAGLAFAQSAGVGAPQSGVEQTTSAPASVTVTVRFTNLAEPIDFTDAPSGFTVPVYFAPGDTAPGAEAAQVLAALADEAAVQAHVAITISAKSTGRADSGALQDARAVAVFNLLSELGVPVRVMALELDQGPGAALTSSLTAI